MMYNCKEQEEGEENDSRIPLLRVVYAWYLGFQSFPSTVNEREIRSNKAMEIDRHSTY